MLTPRMRMRTTVTLFIEAATCRPLWPPRLSNPVFHPSPIAAAWSIHLFLSMILTINIRRVKIPALLTKLIITNVIKVVPMAETSAEADVETEVLQSLHF